MFTCGYGIYKFILFRDMSANVSVLRPQKYVGGCKYGNQIFSKRGDDNLIWNMLIQKFMVL